MFDLPGNYLKTYNPSLVEEHTDSSDFEDDIQISQKKGHHSLVKPDLIFRLPQRNQTRLAGNKLLQQADKNSSFCESKIIQVDDIPVRDVNYNANKYIINHGDHIQRVRSKSSFIKHKIIPSLSCMFRRSNNNTKPLASIKENSVDIMLKDGGCQVQCSNCECEKMRKLNQQSYTVRPVYAFERNVHQITPYTVKYAQGTLNHLHNSNTLYSNTSCTVTMSSDESDEEKEKARRQFKKRLRKELRKEYEKLRLQKHAIKHVEQQYPSTSKINSALIYTSQRVGKGTRIDTDSDIPYFNDMPSTSSGFWDYLFDRIKRKYQTHRAENPNPCFCSKNNSKFAETSLNDPPRGQECCGILKNSYDDQYDKANRTPPPSLATTKKEDPCKKVECQCRPEKPLKHARKTAPSSKAPAQTCNGGTTCQEPHDELTQALAKQYNGEILCIHNPPCILVNGCLNLPLEKERASASVWTAATEYKKASFFKSAKKYINSKTKYDQNCQYCAPAVEVRQCQTSQYKSEKKIQSLCHHKPPCEVVRCCHRNRYDPTLASSCVHVPMCQKVPECMLNTGNPNLLVTPCRHVPKCPDKPICSRSAKYIVLTANQAIGTQVKPQPTQLCRHEPPCILIPKCLGKIMCENYIPHEAIPKCVHQPLCEMIPACCRKTKQMVSQCQQCVQNLVSFLVIKLRHYKLVQLRKLNLVIL
ncbi:hypothetical protein K1T71_005945 [Dendrolimus kikuchii]|uniref:Uncharacterized protein n=1 Tax=Dendrolimus kikuchii TaxID=765133 RepID=A0ACC1D3L4_9NEOP|nr:hypothetical protein K1T71_005945 [Dendrolimus kikuchii]